MTEYTSSPDAIRDYMTAKERTMYWINEFASPNTKHALSPPSVPPTIAAHDDHLLGFTDDDVSESESTRSKPPKMRLHWGDGRPDILISHWHYKDDQQRPPSTSSRTTSDSVGTKRRRTKIKSHSTPPPLPPILPPQPLEQSPVDHASSHRHSHHSKSEKRHSSSSTKPKAVTDHAPPAPQNPRAASPPAVVYAPPKEGSVHYEPPVITKSKPSSRSRSTTPVNAHSEGSHSKTKSPKKSRKEVDDVDDGFVHVRSPRPSRKEKSSPAARPKSTGSEGTYYVLPSAGQKVIVLSPDGTSLSSTTTKATKSPSPLANTAKKAVAPSKPSLMQRIFSFSRRKPVEQPTASKPPAVVVNHNIIPKAKEAEKPSSIKEKSAPQPSKRSDHTSSTRRKLQRRPSEAAHSKLRTSIDMKSK